VQHDGIAGPIDDGGPLGPLATARLAIRKLKALRYLGIEVGDAIAIAEQVDV
jgi:hypothetical protein